jgi:hypothetical protein
MQPDIRSAPSDCTASARPSKRVWRTVDTGRRAPRVEYPAAARGHLVAVESEDRDAVVCRQQERSGVAAPPSVASTIDAGGDLGENLDDLVEHDRHVGESGRRSPCGPLFCRWECRRSASAAITCGAGDGSAVCSLPIGGARRDVSPVVLMASGRSTGLPFADRKTADGRDRSGCGSWSFRLVVCGG